MLRAPDGSPALVHLPAERAALPRLIDWLDHRVDLLGLSGRTSYAVRLCFEEAVLNVIQHGQASTLSVFLGRCAGRLSLCVKDRGPAFDPLGVAPPPRPARLAEAPIGGMGIPLMRAFTTTIAYRRRGGANRLMLCFEG